MSPRYSCIWGSVYKITMFLRSGVSDALCPRRGGFVAAGRLPSGGPWAERRWRRALAAAPRPLSLAWARPAPPPALSRGGRGGSAGGASPASARPRPARRRLPSGAERSPAPSHRRAGAGGPQSRAGGGMCGRTACSLGADNLRRACAYRDRRGRRQQPEWIRAERYRPSYNKGPQSSGPVLLSRRHLQQVPPPPPAPRFANPNKGAGAASWLRQRPLRVGTLLAAAVQRPARPLPVLWLKFEVGRAVGTGLRLPGWCGTRPNRKGLLGLSSLSGRGEY